MKRKARDSQDSSHHIVGESLQTVTEGTAVKLPKLDSLKRTIQHQQAAPVQPITLEQLALSEEYKWTSRGEQFLLYNSGPETQRILIFGTQRNLKMLQLSSVWLADGTFKTAPSLFTQVYVIHALRGGPDLMRDDHLLPSLFVLLPNETEATYTRMWEQVQLLGPQADPAEMLWSLSWLQLTVFSTRGLLLWGRVVSFTSRRTYGARCRQQECRLSTPGPRARHPHPTDTSSGFCCSPRSARSVR